MRIGNHEIDVTALRFFESGWSLPAMEHRDYKKHFSKSESRYIYWELHLAHPAPPGRRIDFIINVTYYKADGSLLGNYAHDAHIEADWTWSYHSNGWGWKELGHWPIDTFWVDLSIDGQKIASSSFKVTPQTPHATATAASGNRSRICPYCGANAVLPYPEDFFWECQNCGQMGSYGDPMEYTSEVLPDEEIREIFGD